LKTYLAIAVLLGASQLANAAATGQTPTERIKGYCDNWIAAEETPPHAIEAIRFTDRCQAFINGVSNEMIGELSWLDDVHKRVVVGNWEDGVTVKQEILIFVDYVNQNPAALNKPATQTLRKSVEAAGIYSYAPVEK
jgi:hypothetical protein